MHRAVVPLFKHKVRRAFLLVAPSDRTFRPQTREDNIGVRIVVVHVRAAPTIANQSGAIVGTFRKRNASECNLFVIPRRVEGTLVVCYWWTFVNALLIAIARPEVHWPGGGARNAISALQMFAALCHTTSVAFPTRRADPVPFFRIYKPRTFSALHVLDWQFNAFGLWFKYALEFEMLQLHRESFGRGRNLQTHDSLVLRIFVRTNWSHLLPQTLVPTHVNDTDRDGNCRGQTFCKLQLPNDRQNDAPAKKATKNNIIKRMKTGTVTTRTSIHGTNHAQKPAEKSRQETEPAQPTNQQMATSTTKVKNTETQQSGWQCK